ncbi:UNVERIFIED_CONTAM: Cyclin-D1-1 [Sesamum calycinum]|uniref:Cyclin-D1-1 n=1 Tax=Sesamum calycinum TaxID=2727403 RepID=A0AAW2QXB4_9LAMI
MSVSCSDCFSDLLCGEDSTIILSGGGDLSSEYSSDLDSPTAEVEEFIAGLLEDERDLAGISSRSTHQPIDSSVRGESVAWIFKVQRYYGFHPLTAYLSVNYFDRFLHSHHLPKMSGWPLQLLSVACLSLAAKMEEPLVPSLLDLQVEGAKFIFEPRTMQRMELLVLRVLDWRLRSISPFSYLCFFALKIDPTGTFTEFLTSRAKELFSQPFKRPASLNIDHLALLLQQYFVQQMICQISLSSLLNMLSHGVMDSTKIIFMSCHQLIRQMTFSIKPKSQPKVLPQLRVMPRASTIPSASSSSSSSSSSSFSFSLSYKRRKLNNSLWSDDEKGSYD